MNEQAFRDRVFPLNMASWLPALYASYAHRLRHLLERLGPSATSAVWQVVHLGYADELLQQILETGWKPVASDQVIDVEKSIAATLSQVFPAAVEGVSMEEARQLVEEMPPIQQIRQVFPSLNVYKEATAHEALHLRLDGLALLTKALIQHHGKEGELIAYDMHRDERIRAGEGRTGSVSEFIAGFAAEPEEANLFTAGLVKEILHVSESEVVCHIKDCAWAGYFRERHPEVGYLLACSTDEAGFATFNADLRMQRTSTLLEGGSLCDFRIYAVDQPLETQAGVAHPRPGVRSSSRAVCMIDQVLSHESYHLRAEEVYPRQAIHGFQLSPDGRRLSFVLQREKRVDEVSEGNTPGIQATASADLCFLASSGGYPQPLTATGDVTAPPVWSPDGKWLAFEQDDAVHVMAVDGGQRRRVYRGKLYHPPATRTTDGGAMGDGCWGTLRWRPDGTSILVAVREEFETILRLVDAHGRSQRDLCACKGYIIGWDWSPDGRRIVFTTRNEDGWTGDLRLVDVKKGDVKILHSEDHYAYQAPVAAWVSNEHILFRSNRSGWSKLWVRSIDSSAITPLTSGDWDDYAFRLSPSRNQVVYASREAQSGSGDDLWIRPISGGEPVRLTQHPGVNVPLGWSKAGEIFYWHSSPTERGDLWSVSSAGGEPQRLTWSMPVELERKLNAPQEIVLRSDEGSPIPSLVYLPAYYQDGERYPAIVWIHGGPTMLARYDFSPYCNWLANLGYVVIVPNYRGSVGYGISHMNAVSGDGLGKNDLSDVLSTGRYAQTLPYVDLSRGLGVGGRSWGGYLALMAVTQATHDFSCAVVGAAISDWFVQQAETEVRYYDRWLVGGWVYEQHERAKERSPINFVERVKVPLFIFHGEKDASVPFAQMEAFVEKARQAGATVDFVGYPLEGHSNSKPENQQDTLDRTKAFFRRHLQAWNLRDNPSADQVQ